jgi:hypothetical protein
MPVSNEWEASATSKKPVEAISETGNIQYVPFSKTFFHVHVARNGWSPWTQRETSKNWWRSRNYSIAEANAMTTRLKGIEWEREAWRRCRDLPSR